MKVPAKKRIVLLDAHAIIHRAYHALPDFRTQTGVPTGALFGFGSMILKIISDLKPEIIIACYDLPGKTFRHESFDDYKKGRAETDETLKLQFNATRELCEALAIPIYDAPGFEADDILGTIIKQLESHPEYEIIIASGDMDTLQLIEGTRVRVYTLKRNIKETVIYDESAVVERFGFSPLSVIDYKALRGDPSDNIPGIKGIGEKAATLAIQNFGTIEKMYEIIEKGDLDTLSQAGLTQRMITLITEGKEEAEFSKIIATIRYDAPIDFVIPTTSWKSLVDIEKANLLFQHYELRSLSKRLYEVLDIEKDLPVETLLSEREQHELFIKLWILDSDKTNADTDDVLEYTGMKSLDAAIKIIDTQLKEEKDLSRVFYEIEQPLISVVQEMHKRGILIDKIFLKNLSESYHKELKLLEQEIFRIADASFNIKSPKQLSEILFEKMKLPTKGIKKSKTGSYSTNIDTLKKLEGESPLIEKIIEYRELEKLVSTYIDVIPDMTGHDGRLHAEFVQNGTVTGRFSSRNPNMQNIPTRTDLGRKIREGFIAEKGFKLISLDYSQIELRCLALLSQDTELIKIFNNEQDIHTGVAARIGGVSVDNVDREMRRKAKIVNFGILYGMGINSLKREMQSTREEAQTFYDGFFAQFPEATRFLEKTKEQARELGFTQTLFGRKRQFKNIKSPLPFVRAMAERMALNAPIQGTQADIIKLAMIHIEQWLHQENKKEEARLLLQIHDEIIYEVKDEYVHEFSKKSEEIMKQVLKKSSLQYESPVSLVVHSSIGNHWGELK